MIKKDGRQTAIVDMSASWHTAKPVAEVSGAVYGHRTGRGLGDCCHIKKFFLSHPVTACDEFIFQKCNHRVATAKGESADFKKHKEKGT